MTASDDVLSRNADRKHAAPENPLPAPPGKQLAIVTCMDCRIDLYDAAGVKPGEAHVIRNAGGVVTEDVIRSLAVSQRKLGTREIMLMHHTKCGMGTFTDEDFLDELENTTGHRPSFEVGTFTDTEQDVRDGVAQLRRSPYLVPETTVRGFIHDLDTDQFVEVF
jgi:carbonic anhydrase